MIWWTGLVPWEFEFPLPGSRISSFPCEFPFPGSLIFTFLTPKPETRKQRVVMLYLGLDNVRKTSLFPRDPNRLTP